MLRCVSNSSHIRVSTVSGSFRVTTTSGFLPFAISPPLGAPQGLSVTRQGPQLPDVQSSLTAPAETRELAGMARQPGPSLPDGPGQDKAAARNLRLPARGCRKTQLAGAWRRNASRMRADDDCLCANCGRIDLRAVGGRGARG